MTAEGKIPPMRRWQLESETELGRYKIFTLSQSVRRSPESGRSFPFFRLDAPDWVNVIALTDAGEMVLVEQYRHGTDEITIEIPGGAVDPEEQPWQAAARELEEETGYRPEELILIGEVKPNPAFLSNTCWTYLALGCRGVGQAAPDPAEELRVLLTSLQGFTSMIDDQKIDHSLVIAAHDHLRRGLAADRAWADRVRPLLSILGDSQLTLQELPRRES